MKSTFFIYLVNLSYHSIKHFSLEWSEDNSLILDWINNKASAWLYDTSPNVVYCGHSYNKAIPENTKDPK